jgi:2-methylcitrate dehydratase PrpD
MAKTISERLAECIQDTTVEKLPPAVMEIAKLCFLDWLGSAIAGSTARPIRIVVEVIKGLGGKPQATVIPDGSRTSCHLAAFVNAAASHVVEMDDLHKPSVLHPAAPVIPAALAIAERDGIPGGGLLAAVVAGYEVAIRAGKAVGPTHYHYWHTTGTCGVFGAAAAVGKLLRLNREQLVWALGTAGTQASGLWEFLVDGAMSKQLHPAKAAADGLLSALLAQKGFSGAIRIFEGEKGFCAATSEKPDLSQLTEGLGDGPYQILENSFKAHAACYHIHSTIDAVLTLRRQHHLKPNEIKKIHVRLYSAAVDLLEKVEPVNPYAAKFSIPYCVAAAFRHGRMDLEDFNEEALRDSTMRRLMSTVELQRDPTLDHAYPEKWPAVVAVETATGKRLEARVDYPKGDPKNPMSREELIEKFHRLTAFRIPEVSRHLLIERSLTLEALPSVQNLLAPLDLKSDG